jgi:hypothetical protein
MNMIQLKNRPFAGKAPTTTQQAEFSIGWRFCPVCGNKLYQKIEGCSGILQVKCNRCKETLRLDLAFRCSSGRSTDNTDQKAKYANAFYKQRQFSVYGKLPLSVLG